MFIKKKERLYIYDIIDDPAITYPMYYTVSSALKDNEMLHVALNSIHQSEFEFYRVPNEASEIFLSLEAGSFVIFKEQYVVGYFQGRLMYLESSGWKSFNITKDIFNMDNWLV
jgi:hypothetical protein